MVHVVEEKKRFSQGSTAPFSSKSKQYFHKHSRKEKNEKILSRISHSPLPIPPPFSSLSYGQKLTKYISLYLINIEHRELRCSDLSCQALPVEGIYRRVGNPFNIGLRFVALINNHSDVTRHCYNQKTLEAPQKGWLASVFQYDYKKQLDVASKSGIKGSVFTYSSMRTPLQDQNRRTTCPQQFGTGLKISSPCTWTSWAIGATKASEKYSPTHVFVSFSLLAMLV